MNISQYTPANITELKPNEIFVFGSNVDGIHGAGAAKAARERFGAELGVPEGLTGQCYAIPTVSFKLKRNRERYPLCKLETSIYHFLQYAAKHPELTFLLTPIGCGLAGFKEDEVCASFIKFRELISENIVFPKIFMDIILKEPRSNP